MSVRRVYDPHEGSRGADEVSDKDGAHMLPCGAQQCGGLRLSTVTPLLLNVR